MRVGVRDGRLDCALGFGLIAAVSLVFCRAVQCEFITLDDPVYITENRHVRAGLTLSGAAWAFTTTNHGCNWHPLTSLSHMVDCAFFGLNPAGHHAVSVGLHAGNTLLLFLVLRQMTGARWRAALTALLFGLHPLRVESVVWASERKDVLSGLFFMLTVLAYLQYVRSPGRLRYGAVCAALALGLMAKPILVTLPCVLLLLDYWPLGRLAQGGAVQNPWRRVRTLVWEKAPLFALAAASGVATIAIQHSGGALRTVGAIAMPWRLANALVAYVGYIGKTFWPTRLAAYYPHPGSGLPMWQVLAATAVLGGVTALVVRYGRRRKYLVTGWFWYLIVLLPVIGLVQAGSQAMADRYTYLSQMGLLIMVIWGGAELAGPSTYRRAVAWSMAGAGVLALSVLTWFQVGHWRNSRTLFRHALAVTSDNAVAHNCLGIALADEGRLEEGMRHYREALRIRPGYSEAMGNLGAAFAQQGRPEEAASLLGKAVAIDPHFVKARHNLGLALLDLGRTEEAGRQLATVVAARPADPDAHNNLGTALARSGDMRGAIAAYGRAVALDPSLASAYLNLGKALREQGAFAQAVEMYAAAVRLNPNHASAHYNLGALLATMGRLDEARNHWQSAARLAPARPVGRAAMDALERSDNVFR